MAYKTPPTEKKIFDMSFMELVYVQGIEIYSYVCMIIGTMKTVT